MLILTVIKSNVTGIDLSQGKKKIAKKIIDPLNWVFAATGHSLKILFSWDEENSRME
jgi:hypothetical protein